MYIHSADSPSVWLCVHTYQIRMGVKSVTHCKCVWTQCLYIYVCVFPCVHGCVNVCVNLSVCLCIGHVIGLWVCVGLCVCQHVCQSVHLTVDQRGCSGVSLPSVGLGPDLPTSTEPETKKPDNSYYMTLKWCLQQAAVSSKGRVSLHVSNRRRRVSKWNFSSRQIAALLRGHFTHTAPRARSVFPKTHR